VFFITASLFQLGFRVAVGMVLLLLCWPLAIIGMFISAIYDRCTCCPAAPDPVTAGTKKKGSTTKKDAKKGDAKKESAGIEDVEACTEGDPTVTDKNGQNVAGSLLTNSASKVESWSLFANNKT
jgi:hypothetical protein